MAPLAEVRMRVLGMIILAFLLGGCTRAHYRRTADRDTYGATAERNCDPRWAVPRLSIDPPPGSRLHDPYNPDHPPLPPDDPAAHRYMVCADGHRGSRRWHRDGDAPWIEDPSWYETLPLSEEGILVLNADLAVGLGLLNSREYQTQLENLYLSALALTLNRFEFMAHWFATNMTSYIHAGSSETESNTLNTTSTAGFTRAFTAGGQFMIELANNIVFEFAGRDHTSFNSNITFSLMQPLLRGAGRDVRMEGLTEAERTLLYTLRSFARFRKTFTFNVATSGYLNLLAQEQQIRNQQQTLASQEQNYRLHEALFANGIVSTVKVDQVFQSVQQSRLNLIQAEASLETQRDLYKNTLGLPPNIPIRLDDAVLAPFQLNNPDLTRLQADLNQLLAEYRELDVAPSVVKLEEGFRRLKAFREGILPFEAQVGQELDKWKQKLAEPEDDPERVARERVALQARARDLEEVHVDLLALRQKIERSASGITEDRRKQAWEALQDRIRDLDAAAAQLFVIQTQVRVYLIRLTPVRLEEGEATRYALENRLDLMNVRAEVVDAWRKITVTASALKAGLDVMVNGNIATPPNWGNPVDFRASASTYTVGVQFDAPLNRFAERNAYRAAQIAYQQARRNFMAQEDLIQRQIRADLRQLRTNRLSFEIARQSLIAAARQVEAAREDLLLGNVDPTATLNILNALDNVLTFKNALINSWVSYETGRYQLLLDMEALQLDDRGLYRNEHNDPSAPPTPPVPPPLAPETPALVRQVPGKWARPSRLRANWWKILLAVAALAGLGWGVRVWFFPAGGQASEITATVTRGTLVITVSERAELESSKTLEVRCEVEGRENKIVWIVPEGTRVTKGEKVLTFDTDALNKLKADQEVKVKQAEGKAKGAKGDLEVAKNKAADDIEKAKLALKLAVLDKEKYLDAQGEYTADVQDKRGALALAKKDLEEAKDKLEQFRKSVKKGLFPAEQLRIKEADFAQKQYAVSRDEAKLVVLEKFTRQRQEAELTAKADDAKRVLERAESSGEASIAKAQSDLEAAEITFRLEKTTLERIEKQLAGCTVTSPGDGILVYSKQRWWDDNSRIQAGAMVFFHQPLFSLPDLTQMQMKVKIHEAQVKKVKPGQKAEVRIDAYGNHVLHGTVKSVATMASADVWGDRFVKEYETIVTIDDLPLEAGLKPGFTGDVKIQVNEIPDVLMVPVQAVGQMEGQHFCFVAAGNGFERRAVTVGENNDKFVEIKEGLSEGEKVALDARARLAAAAKTTDTKPPEPPPARPPTPPTP